MQETNVVVSYAKPTGGNSTLFGAVWGGSEIEGNKNTKWAYYTSHANCTLSRITSCNAVSKEGAQQWCGILMEYENDACDTVHAVDTACSQTVVCDEHEIQGTLVQKIDMYSNVTAPIGFSI